MAVRARDAYRRVYLESAPPARVLDELYLRLEDDLATATTAIAARDFARKGSALNHALAIVAELDAALDRGSAPSLCAQLGSLYAFVRDRINSANAKADAAPVAQAMRVVTTLREAFRDAGSGFTP